MDTNILAIDIGTSSCKAAVFSEDGQMLALEKGSYSLLFPKDNYVEQNPDEIFHEIGHTISKLQKNGCDLSHIAAVSFSAQISAPFLADRGGKPLTNLISWMDKRAAEEAKIFNREFPPEKAEALTGVDMMVTPAYNIPKLRWLHEHEPGLTDGAAKFVQIKDYVIFLLTGKWVSDMTSLKGLVNQQTLQAIPEILSFTGASEELLPNIRRPFEIAGFLNSAEKGYSDLPQGIPVITGWNDMNAAFLGMGGMMDGCIGLDLTGTSEHLGCVQPKSTIEREAYKGLNRVPFLKDRELFYGVTSSGGQAVEWYVKDFIGAKDIQAYFESLFQKAGGVPAVKDDSLIFLPYLEGERNPWDNPDARGVFFGLNRSHQQIDLGMAVLEGVSFALRAIFDCFPQKPEFFVVSGGASQNAVWNQIKADVINTAFITLKTSEAGCAGAAILAECALHPEKSMEKTAEKMFQPADSFKPDPCRHRIYEKKYRQFLSLYHGLEPLFKQKAAVQPA